MNDKHCVSLEIAKQLKEAGWKKETEFWWEKIFVIETAKLYPQEKVLSIRLVKGKPIISEEDDGVLFYPAPLATEILEELPEEFEYKEHTYRLQIGKNDKWYAVWYDSTDKIEINSAWSKLTFNEENEDTLPNALAKMWLYLKKERLIE